MKTAKYGRLESFCPMCGSLNQRRIDTLLVDNNNITIYCNGCQDGYFIALLTVAVDPATVIDDTPQELIDELAEKTATRVTPKSLSRNTKKIQREMKD